MVEGRGREISDRVARGDEVGGRREGRRRVQGRIYRFEDIRVIPVRFPGSGWKLRTKGWRRGHHGGEIITEAKIKCKESRAVGDNVSVLSCLSRGLQVQGVASI